MGESELISTLCARRVSRDFGGSRSTPFSTSLPFAIRRRILFLRDFTSESRLTGFSTDRLVASDFSIWDSSLSGSGRLLLEEIAFASKITSSFWIFSLKSFASVFMRLTQFWETEEALLAPSLRNLFIEIITRFWVLNFFLENLNLRLTKYLDILNFWALHLIVYWGQHVLFIRGL